MSNKLIIKIDKTTISNDKIYQEGFELAESLCSQSELRFGCCESSVLKLKIRNEFGELNGKTLDVLIALNGDTENLFKIGTYKVETCERSGGRQYLNITAYDKMYDIINANVTEWYDSLTFPLSMKAFRDSFFAYINVSQETTVLTQDSVIIEKTIDADEISGLKVISAICELNGAFGNVDKNGVFKYIFLEKELEPIKTYAKYVSCEYEDFTTKPISKVQVRQEEGDIGAISGTGDNTYIVNDNFLVYGKSPSDLSAIADRLFAKIKGVSYIPFKATVQGDPCVEVGDVIKISTKTKEVTSYLLERTIKGIQSLKDSFESKGVYEYSEKVNSANKETRQLKGKVNKLTRTVEETVSEIKDLEKNIDTKITQTAEEIFSEASKKFVTEESIEELQRQIDGAIETFTGSAVPTVSNYPTIEWVTSEEKDKHIGDLFIVNDKGGEYAGFYYRFEKDDSAYSWVLLKDNEITKALQDSKEANEKSEEAKKKALEVEKSLADNYITETEVKSAIKQSAEEISTSVSKTYSTKSEVSSAKNEAISSANTNAANQLKNYSTTTQMNSAINQSAESIKSTVASTYTTKEDFKNLEVGGRNLIRNSAFLSGKKRWTFGTNVTLDMEKTFNGHPTVKSEQSGLTSSSYRGVSNYYLPNNPTSVSAGETYTISCWYYVEDASLLDKRFILEMKGYKPEAIYSTKLGGADFTAASCAVGQWTKLQKTFTVNADYKNCFIYVSIERNGIVWFADLKLEKGAKATDWTPAPEDMATGDELGEIANRVVQSESNIIQLSNRIATEVSERTALGTKVSSLEQTASGLTVRVNNTESTANAALTNANKAQSSVDNLKIGGRNLLKNTNILYKRTNADTQNRTYSFFLADDFDYQSLIGYSLTYSFWLHSPGEKQNANTSNADMNARFGCHGTIQWSDSTGENTESSVQYPYAKMLFLTNAKSRVSNTITVTPPSGYDTIDSVHISIQLYAKPASSNEEIWEIGYPKLELGNRATDWTPAPEDSESEIAEVKTIATQTADKFSWIVDSGTSASNFTITDRFATLTAQRINLNGLVTFSGLDNNTQTNILNGVNALNTANSIVQNIYKDNTTMIDGGKIATNTITADKINTTELFAKQITLSDNVVAYPTLQDVDIIQKIMLGKITPTEAQKKLYDFNADGTISLVDVVRAQRLISGATTYGEHPEYQAPTGMATVDINFKNPEKIISIVTSSPFAAGTAKTSIGANKVETTRVLCDSLTAKRAELMPVNDEYEGGEIQLNGVGDYEDVVVDNYKGTLRIFDTNTAKPIVFDLVNNNITGGYSFDGGLSGTFSTSGLSIISGRATIISGGYYKSSGMVFVQMNIKLLTDLGTNEWWGIASGFPKPRNNYVALAVSTVDSSIGVVNASIENSLLCIRTSDGMVQGLTANQILTFTGIYLT